ncbi:MAG: 23S rRNA (pseudouridine(1915)-N(3))-methyltransferase RlmH, partial [Paracoccaceae bacterium]
MRLTIAAVGRLKPGPEQTLIDDYTRRAGVAGRALALGPVDIIEIDERKAKDRTAQSERLRAAIPEGAKVIALDERGRMMTSPKFAELLARQRDGGCSHLVFLVGGAGGVGAIARARGDHMRSFG